MADDLVTWVHARLDADDAISDDATLLILAALEGKHALADMAGYTPPLPPEPVDDETEPIGAFLKRITVAGFRGIGPRSQLNLDPQPSLTVISGRNGSGKSSFAEALEVALTGNTYRWSDDRPAVWRQHWRNIHDGEDPRIDVVIAEEGEGPTTLTVDWPADAEKVDDMTTAVQRHGQKKQAGLDSLGWAAPMETYRPLLTYEELGAVLSAEPKVLYDALSTVLGLEQMTAAVKALDEHQKTLNSPATPLRNEKKALVAALQGLDDERAARALAIVKPTLVDAEELRRIATGTTDDDGSAAALRALLTLAVPSSEACDAAAGELTAAVGELATVADRVGEGLQRRDDLLAAAIALHDHDGDQPCPVCATGRLDVDRVSAMRAELADHQRDTADLRAARQRLADAQSAARSLVVGVPSALAADLPVGLEDSSSSAILAWEQWADTPPSDLDLAGHLTVVPGPLRTALGELQRQAQEQITALDEAWSRVAARLAAFADASEAWQLRKPEADTAKAAHKWMKDNEIVLKNERVQPIAAEAKRIWAGLRQESNVEIAGLTLESSNTRRRVTISAEVDGEDAGALAVMSQGELHSLALALFLPRATMPESPFRFVVLDDPVQAMDPAKVDGLVAVLLDIAATRQVIVFSHDDRFASAVRRAPKGVPVRIVEITRAAGSKVSASVAFSPSKRYLNDAFGIVKDAALPDETLRRVLPGLLRMALEAAARDVYFAREVSAGVPHADVEAAWEGAKKTRERLGLALGSVDVEKWLGDRPYRRWALKKANSIHTLLEQGEPVDACRDVEKTVADLQAGVT
ncbi:MAG TPA: AAA family ATPase [Gordonia sp. (in: high G+C Gram-positive bacteria)]|uniref:AAA family ATPase n=1 Tax=unclassified Gordonia (in: high G+C Gram-positive bacteria) TaxID=2657482 RepID=UPI000F93907C|nr:MULTISPECIES: AAA family ATPase [unclassified Gordonia (in: high G+C Gram-positive bacteria)]RUP38453.1 MAG: DUF2813 domain-containing protein [Gordonia sp. (in: high G+C Gram-positive bacteria)]HNP58243.1 AAA family ATPase [Gordonia sp. (in: high G+C Gram-positive bacteria)]HRC52108.1 AAA family ATPase [Gordonia sp. (in: high G+C Gram-positive bacteria)]